MIRYDIGVSDICWAQSMASWSTITDSALVLGLGLSVTLISHLSSLHSSIYNTMPCGSVHITHAILGLHNCAGAHAIFPMGTIHGLPAQSMDSCFEQHIPWIVQIHALTPTYVYILHEYTYIIICDVWGCLGFLFTPCVASVLYTCNSMYM